VKFAFIDAQKARYPISILCRVLQVRRGGFYAWRASTECRRRRHNVALSTQIRAAFQRSRGTCGSPRIHAELSTTGLRTSKRRVQRADQGAREGQVWSPQCPWTVQDGHCHDHFQKRLQRPRMASI
jgi:hypothetical protein